MIFCTEVWITGCRCSDGVDRDFKRAIEDGVVGVVLGPEGKVFAVSYEHEAQVLFGALSSCKETFQSFNRMLGGTVPGNVISSPFLSVRVYGSVFAVEGEVMSIFGFARWAFENCHKNIMAYDTVLIESASGNIYELVWKPNSKVLRTKMSILL